MQIYLDCDGVLANFEDGASKAFGMNLREYEKIHGTSQFWKVLEETPDFFTNLELMPDAKDLVFGVIKLIDDSDIPDPIILTARPWGNWSRLQKLAWGEKHFPYLHMITTDGGENKYHHCKPGDILIDDYLKYKTLWEQAGGKFIHHINTNNSLIALKEVLNNEK